MQKFYIGADIGTNSVGIACTDENYNLLRAKGQDCWSVRLFEEAKTAEERRTFRTARRRLARRKQRINWLQSLFAPYIEDKTFFIRLNNSQYLPEDKNALLKEDRNTLFAGEYDDKKFHAEFPTIYHLRKALMSDNDYDLRFYYLALHHIIKYRGHFLFEGSIDDVRNFDNTLSSLNEILCDRFDSEYAIFDKSFSENAKNVLVDSKKGVKDKQSDLEKLFGAKDKFTKEIIKGFCGAKISPSVLFGDEYKEEKSLSFKDLTDETFEEKRSAFGDNFVLLEAIRSIYNFVTFEKILEGNESISSAMIAIYEKHKSDLALLKNYIRAEKSDAYFSMFKSTKESYNYVNYIGYTKKGGKKINVKKCSDDDFYGYIKKCLSGDTNDEDTRKRILTDIENHNFLPKIIHSDNGIFPRQINEAELLKIISVMVSKHPETSAFADKILPLFRYRIPYYVGPLTGNRSWAIRTAEPVTPWNFDNVVDKAKSNEEFMRRMTNKCSYLHGEDVLPKHSIVYQKYNVLNQLNKLRINDAPISVELKQLIFNKLFLVYPKVTDKKIKDLLVRSGYFSQSEISSVAISGKDGEFNASMSSYITLKRILGDFVDKDLANNGGVCENIILWHALNTDKSIVEDLIKKNYRDIPEIKKNVKTLKGLSFNEFGRMSAKFLNEITATDKTTGEVVTILDLLYDTNKNLNEILFDKKYNFDELIKAENGEITEQITYRDVEDLYVSPAVRRGIWQTLTIIDEYVKTIGKVPDKIFVEVTREDGIKGDAGRKISRKNDLLLKYKNIESAYAGIVDKLKEDRFTDMKLRQERLYLYFRQLGRCMYTGSQIDLDQLNTNTYDVDHILPRTYVKDDSLDNKVLVCRKANSDKADIYPIPQEFRKQQSFWKMLLDKKLIARSTYDRLMRTEPLTQDDFSDFINRQKVITDQTAKAVAELLQRKYPNTKIVYSKAKNVSDFKQKFDLFKCRETNDLHHARDAYLNVVVGNVYDTVFSTPMGMARKDGDVWRIYNLKNMFTRNVAGAWNETSISLVKKTFGKCTMTVTRYVTCSMAGFYNQNASPKYSSGITAPRKSNGVLSDVSKYGGYMKQPTAYFAIVLSVNAKGNEVKTIEAVPALTAYRQKTNPDALVEYFATYLKTPKVLVSKIKKYQLISYNGTPCYLVGITGSYIIVHNAVELFIDNRNDEYVTALSKLSEMFAKKTVDGNEDRYVMKTNRDNKEKLVIERGRNVELYSKLKDKLNDKIYGGLLPFKTFRKNLEKGTANFNELSTLNQALVLLQVLKFFQCNAELSDLTKIGGSGQSGRLLFNADITNANIELIDYSPAGLTVKKRKV